MPDHFCYLERFTLDGVILLTLLHGRVLQLWTKVLGTLFKKKHKIMVISVWQCAPPSPSEWEITGFILWSRWWHWMGESGKGEHTKIVPNQNHKCAKDFARNCWSYISFAWPFRSWVPEFVTENNKMPKKNKTNGTTK